MSWQRIDENTNIDDTLVTCAEYQLFIDEMREQGKFYQPDHWTLYQFPEGKARDPILGVRYSDAIAFCRWLTKREDNNCKFRLPSHQEVIIFIVNQTGLRPLGYWYSGLDNKPKFIWTGLLPINPRAIDLKHIQNLPSDLNAVIVGSLTEPRELDISIAHEHISFYAPAIGSLERMREDPYNDIAYYASDKHNQIFSEAFAYSYDLAHNRNPNYEPYHHALNMISDIITLQERIAGRSPAFEGIRLVKERIR